MSGGRSKSSRDNRRGQSSDLSDQTTQEVFVESGMAEAVVEYWLREFARVQYNEKCKAVGVTPDHEFSPRQVLKNTAIMMETWDYWRKEPNCTGVDFWIGARDREIHAYPRFIMSSHTGSHPQTR